MDQSWFEMKKERNRDYNRAVWIPLRVSECIEKNGEYGQEGFKEEFYGLGTLAVFSNMRERGEQLSWQEIGIGCSHSTYIDDGKYISANEYVEFDGSKIGEQLVIEQTFNSQECDEWHLSQDFVVALGLKREGDSWVRPNEGYKEIARLLRDSENSPIRVEVLSSHLKDYLCARQMTLRVTSYRERVEVVENIEHITWPKDGIKESTGNADWEGRIQEIHEGGMFFGEVAAIHHFGRNDVDEEEDVPEFGLPTGDEIDSTSWTKKYEGRKLYRLIGEFWKNEWVEAGERSPIVARDKITSNVYFITDAEGTTENSETLIKGSRWLWFKPEVVMELLKFRGSGLGWYTKDTGSVGCSPSHGVHFGVNRIGLINVYAKDIGQLPIWQQKIWVGFNVNPDGKVSEELLSSQMKAIPAKTKAPERYLKQGIKDINDSTFPPTNQCQNKI